MKIQSHSFDAPKSGDVSKVAVGALTVGLLSTGAFAADPTWYTELTTQLTTIAGYVVAVLAAVVGIRLAPLAWTHIKSVLYR